MAKQYPIGFRIMIPEPVEVKMVSPTLFVRNSIDFLERYRGLFTYCVEDDTFYYLKEGVTNEHWEPIGKPQLVTVLDEFTGVEQAIISGYGLKTYLEQNYYTKSEVDSLLAGIQIPAHIATITPQEVEKLKTIQGDFTKRIDFPNSQMVWVIPHPTGKKPSVESYLANGKRIYGNETSDQEKTIISWGRPFSGFVEIN